jgi:uncharacterized protein involved in exopolysaccharide biosynthesis
VAQPTFPRADAFVPPLPRVNFSHYAGALWRRRVLIAGLTILCAALGLTVALLSAPQYLATATVAIVQPRIPDTQPIGSSTFVYLIRNRQSVAQTIAQFHLSDPPSKLTIDRFLDGVLSVNEIRTTNLISIGVRLRDAKLASDVTNDVVARAIATSRRFTGEQTSRARDVFGSQLSQQQERLRQAQQKVIAFRIENHLDVLGQDVTTLMNGNGETSDLFMRLATASSRLAAADRQIAKLPPEKQEQLAQLQMQYELAGKAYANAETQFESAQLNVETRSAELHVIDPAVPPDRPASPRPLRDTATALLFGLIGSTLVVLIVAALRPPQ